MLHQIRSYLINNVRLALNKNSVRHSLLKISGSCDHHKHFAQTLPFDHVFYLIGISLYSDKRISSYSPSSGMCIFSIIFSRNLQLSSVICRCRTLQYECFTGQKILNSCYSCKTNFTISVTNKYCYINIFLFSKRHL